MNKFNRCFDGYKYNLSRDLISAGEGDRVNRIMKSLDDHKGDFETFFHSGIQSCDSEILELKLRIEKSVSLLRVIANKDEAYSSIEILLKYLEGYYAC